MSLLITAETFFNEDGIMGLRDNETNLRVALWANYRYPAPDPIAPRGDAVTPVAIAYVNQGRWMADCPFGCGSSQVVSETDPRFYCCGGNGCQNYAVRNMTIPVFFPEPIVKDGIEAILISRPRVFRNWTTGETLEKLQLENDARSDLTDALVLDNVAADHTPPVNPKTEV